MRLTPLQKHLITDQRYPSLHSGYKRSPDQPLSYCSGETANSSLNGASEPSPLFAYRTEKLHHPWSYYSGETANSSLNGASEPSPLFAYRTEKLHYPAFHNDIIRTLSKTRGKDANSKHRKYQKHPKHSTEKLKHRAVPDQLNHERTTFKKKSKNDSFTNSSERPSIILNKPSMPPTDGQSTGTPDGGSSNSPPNYRIYALMARPNSAGALSFDGTGVSEFLRRWNNECDDCGFTESQKCSRLPDYCNSDIKEVVELLDGYTSGSWETLQTELKELFWQHDQQKDIITIFNKFIHEILRFDLNVFIFKYIAISKALVDKNVLSILDHVNRYLDDLSKRFRDQVLNYCAKQE